MIRSQESLERTLVACQVLANEFEATGAGGNLRLWYETRDMLTIARLTLQAAVGRRERRGAHFRSDYPVPDDQQWRRAQMVEQPPETGLPRFEWTPVGLE